MIKHFQITQSNKFALSLKYLKKEVRNGGHFWYADKHQGFYKVVLSILMEVTRHVQNILNMMLVIFLQYIKKICCYWFVLYCYAKHSDILRGSSHVCCYLLVKKSHSILLQTNCTHFGKSELFSTNIYQTFCFTAKHISWEKS